MEHANTAQCVHTYASNCDWEKFLFNWSCNMHEHQLNWLLPVNYRLKAFPSRAHSNIHTHTRTHTHTHMKFIICVRVVFFLLYRSLSFPRCISSRLFSCLLLLECFSPHSYPLTSAICLRLFAQTHSCVRFRTYSPLLENWFSFLINCSNQL